MEGFNSYKKLREERKKIKSQRKLVGEEIQNSFLTLGKSGTKTPWYKDFGNWIVFGDLAYEIYKRFSKK